VAQSSTAFDLVVNWEKRGDAGSRQRLPLPAAESAQAFCLGVGLAVWRVLPRAGNALQGKSCNEKNGPGNCVQEPYQ